MTVIEISMFYQGGMFQTQFQKKKAVQSVNTIQMQWFAKLLNH